MIKHNNPKSDFIYDLNSFAESYLKKESIEIKHVDLPYLDYLRFRHRRIQVKPRSIIKSDEFLCPAGYEDKLKALEKRMTEGSDLNPFLTKTINDGLFEDDLLNYWAIYHFHLADSIDPKNPGFSSRSDKILLAIVNDTTVYMLKVV